MIGHIIIWLFRCFLFKKKFLALVASDDDETNYIVNGIGLNIFLVSIKYEMC